MTMKSTAVPFSPVLDILFNVCALKRLCLMGNGHTLVGFFFVYRTQKQLEEGENGENKYILLKRFVLSMTVSLKGGV